jgi:hypothetical protein
MATAWEAAVGEPAADSDRGGRRWCEELLCAQDGALRVLDLEDAVERQVADLADELREGVEIDRLGVRSGAFAPGPWVEKCTSWRPSRLRHLSPA